MASESTDKPRVLVLGGCGSIGRNFVKHLVDNDLCSHITVADKAQPFTAHFAQQYLTAFESPVVNYVQADLTREAHIDRAFAAGGFAYVVNLAAETKYGQTEEVYEQKCHQLSVACATRAAAEGVALFVEVSTAHVYRSQNRRAAREDGATDPWTLQAAAKLRAEEDLRAIDGLNLMILRPAIVYGPADTNGLMPRIICAASYWQMGTKMKFLWTRGLKVNTVHVHDVCRAIWWACERGQPGLFNVADSGNTDQGRVNAVLSEVFGIRTGFHGRMISNLARLNMGEIVAAANEQHMRPWSDLCRQHSILNTPLTPFIDRELLLSNHLFVDGSAIAEAGFAYEFPELETAAVQAVVQYNVDAGFFPPIMGLEPAVADEGEEEEEAED